MRRVIESEELLLVRRRFANGVDHETPAGRQTREGRHDRLPGRRGIDDRSHALSRIIEQVSRPRGPELFREHTFFRIPRKHEDR